MENEFKIQLTLPAPNPEVAKEVANEAQYLIDRYGYDTFLKLVKFMKQNPMMVEMGINMIKSYG